MIGRHAAVFMAGFALMSSGFAPGAGRIFAQMSDANPETVPRREKEPVTMQTQPSVQDSWMLTATLVDTAENAAKGAAIVEAKVSGVALASPGAGPHLHYRLDNGPAIETADTQMRFQQLPPGAHAIGVVLVDKDHHPMGPEQFLNVAVP
jgi:hypothetical protein